MIQVRTSHAQGLKPVAFKRYVSTGFYLYSPTLELGWHICGFLGIHPLPTSYAMGITYFSGTGE
jgi:hypothetical protein